ncbi:MAG: hypothetical protein B6I34_10035 [Anaerolineaceae bacterium 4572_32.1]|nr:MAG: hypothetical protein B6I34_10035 [Anaerolineaceae bacterium 4572_32.1]
MKLAPSRRSIMPKCPNCGANISDQDTFCGECGARVADAPAVPLESSEPVGEYIATTSEKTVTEVKKTSGKPIALFALIGCAVIMVMLVVCGALLLILTNNSQSTSTPVSIPQLTAIPSVRADRSAPIFVETFDNNSRQWAVWEDENGEKGVDKGVYYITVNKKEWASWGTLESQSFDDFVIEVEAKAIAGPDDNGYGLVFRYQDSDNFYYYEISSDGYYSIGKLLDYEWETLAGWTESDRIKQGRQTNVLRVECDGPQMTFFVNGQKLETLRDGDFKSGSVGFMAEATEETGVRVHFDNLKIWEIK